MGKKYPKKYTNTRQTFLLHDISNMAPLIVILIAGWAWDELSASASRVLLTTCYQIMSEDVIVIIITELGGRESGLDSGHVPQDGDEEGEEERDQEHGMKFLLCLLP